MIDRHLPCRLSLVASLALAATLLGDPATGDDPPATPKGSSTPAEHPAADRPGEPDFQVLFDGKNLDRWKVADTFDFEDHGRVHVDQQRIILEAGKPATGIFLKEPPPRSNYELTLEGRRAEGRDFFCGLTFPVQEEYCTLILGGWGGGVVGLSNVDRNSAVENSTTTFRDFQLGQWYAIRLRVTDRAITVWLDDKQIIHQEVPEHRFNIWWEMEPMRPLGIATWYTRGELRNIRLRHPLDEESDSQDDGESTDSAGQ